MEISKYMIFFLPLLYPLIFLSRSNNGNTPFLSSSYQTLNLIEQYTTVSLNGILSDSRTIPFRPFEYIISKFGFTTENLSLIIILLSSLSIVILLILFDRILSRVKIDNKQRILSLLFFAITPAIIMNILYLPSLLFSLTFLFLSILAKNKNLALIFKIISIIFWPLAILFLFLHNYFEYKQEKIDIKKLKSNFLIFLLIISSYYMLFSFPNAFLPFFYFFNLNLFNLIADFGNIYALSLPIFLLSISGFAVDWFKNRKYFLMYLSILLIFFISTVFNSLIIPLSFFIAYWCSAFLIILYERKWELKNLRNMTFFVISCFILFSSISFINNVTDMNPSRIQTQSLIWMEENGHKGITLSSSDNSDIIQFFSHNKPFIDKLEQYNDLNIQKKEDIDILFYSRDLKETSAIFDKYNIIYVYIDDSMKKGGVWTNNEQGLLFLLKNSEMFKNIYNSQNIEIWEYKNSQQ